MYMLTVDFAFCIETRLSNRKHEYKFIIEDMLKLAVIEEKKFKNIESEWFGAVNE